jgi:hypothetical protein
MKVLLKVLLVIGLILICGGISWGIVVGLIKLITLCFGLVFNLKIATGIWLVIALINFVFRKSNKDK